MSLRSITFLLSLSGVAFLIFLLTLLLYLIQEWIGNEAGDPASQESAAENDQEHGHDLQGQRIVIRDLTDRINAIANAIYAYNEKRDTHERRRSKNEKITIVALSLAAGFAFLTFVAAGISDVIFYGQLGEMQSAGADTRSLARAAKDQADVAQKTLVMSQRPWLFVSGNIEWNGARAKTVFGKNSEVFKMNVKNVGNTIATNIEISGKFAMVTNYNNATVHSEDIKINDIPCVGSPSEPRYSGERIATAPPKIDQLLQFAIDLPDDSTRLFPGKFTFPYLFGCILAGAAFQQRQTDVGRR